MSRSSMITSKPSTTTCRNVCTHCGFMQDHTSIYTEGKKDIRLNRCENCNELIDRYVEYEFTTIMFDLLLLKTKAFIHVLFNYVNRSSLINNNLMRLILSSILLRTYLKFLLLGENDLENLCSNIKFVFGEQGKLVFLENSSIFYFLFILMTLEICVSIGSNVILTWLFQKERIGNRLKVIVLGTMLGEFSELLRVPLIIWRDEINPMSPYITFSITIYNFITMMTICRVVIFEVRENMDQSSNSLSKWLISFIITSFSFAFQWLFSSYFTAFVLQQINCSQDISILEVFKHISFWK